MLQDAVLINYIAFKIFQNLAWIIWIVIPMNSHVAILCNSHPLLFNNLIAIQHIATTSRRFEVFHCGDLRAPGSRDRNVSFEAWRYAALLHLFSQMFFMFLAFLAWFGFVSTFQQVLAQGAYQHSWQRFGHGQAVPGLSWVVQRKGNNNNNCDSNKTSLCSLRKIWNLKWMKHTVPLFHYRVQFKLPILKTQPKDDTD